MLYSASNPFYESLVVSKYIKNHSSETDTIAVLVQNRRYIFIKQKIRHWLYLYVWTNGTPCLCLSNAKEFDTRN
jgi:hypothetical protein